MQRREFLNNYWKYYMELEEDFLKITRYIEIREINYKTCSSEIIKQIQSVGAELDVLFKCVCKFKLEDKKTMRDYTNYILNNVSDIKETKIIVLGGEKEIELLPFKKWEKNNNGNLFWWESYNKIKHNRVRNYELGNFENLLYLLAALYFFEMWFAKNDKEVNKERDIPNSSSQLFEIEGWETKYLPEDSHALSDYEMDEIIKEVFDGDK